MKKYTVIAAVLGVSVAYWFHAEKPESADVGPVEKARTVRLSRPEALPPAAAQEPEATVEFDVGTEMVLGIRVRKDRQCTVELNDYVTPDGEMFSAYTCTPHNPSPPHIYAEYDNETLANMSWSDAEAAALLGQRLIEKNTGRSFELLIRAAALEGGNVERLAWLADMAFNPTALNGEPQVHNLEGRYALAKLSTHLGDHPATATILKQELVNAGVDERRLAELDSHAAALLRKMQDIQRTVIGEVTIGGQDDA